MNSSSHIVNKKKDILILGCTEEKNGNRYLTLVSTVKTKEVLIKYAELWDNIKNLIKAIQGGEACDYGKDFMKIKFNSDSDDNLLLNKILKIYNMTIVIGSVFQEDGKYYLQVFLDECLYGL